MILDLEIRNTERKQFVQFLLSEIARQEEVLNGIIRMPIAKACLRYINDTTDLRAHSLSDSLFSERILPYTEQFCRSEKEKVFIISLLLYQLLLPVFGKVREEIESEDAVNLRPELYKTDATH